MIYMILKYAIPLLLPFALYFLWVFIERRRKAVGGWGARDTPWSWLSMTGLVLVIVSFLDGHVTFETSCRTCLKNSIGVAQLLI